MEGEDLNLLRSKCNSSSDKQENASEAQPEVIGNCDTEETTNVTSGSDCSQVLNADEVIFLKLLELFILSKLQSYQPDTKKWQGHK